MSSEDEPLEVQTSASSNPKRSRGSTFDTQSLSKHSRAEGDSDVTAKKTNESVKAEEQSTTFELVLAIYKKMQDLRQKADQKEQQHWKTLETIFADLENKLAENNKPDSFNADKFSVSAITSSTVGKQFCFPRVFSSLGLWMEQQQQEQQQQQSSTTNSDGEKAIIVPPPRTADGLETILRAKCLWLRPELASDHRRGPAADYWADDSFNVFIKDTIFPIIDVLRVRLPLTISEFAKRETSLQGQPSHKTTDICPAFTNVLFPIHEEHPELFSRNVGFQKLVEITHKLEASRVAIFCGSSGAGKTIGALSAAKYDNPDNVVFFLSASDSCFKALEGHTETDKVIRDKNTLNELSKRIEQYVGDKCFLQKEKNHGKPFNIVIIIDEIGTKPRLLRGLISTFKDISIRLHRFFFEDDFTDENWNDESRIRIIAAGTGATYLHSAPGTKNHYKTFIFDTAQESNPGKYNYYETLLKSTKIVKDKKKNEALHKLLMRLDGEHQKASTSNKAEMWEAVSRNLQQTSFTSASAARTEWPTQTEIETGYLLKNARCAALAVQRLKMWIRHNFTDDDKEVLAVMPTVSMLNDRLPSIMFEVVREYARMNGLSKFEAKEDILKYALAASLHRLPYLGDRIVHHTTNNNNNNNNNSNNDNVPLQHNAAVDASHISQKAYFKVENANLSLITIGGVLLDLCESIVNVNEENETSLHPFLPKKPSSSSSSSQSNSSSSSSSSSSQSNSSSSENNEKSSEESATPCVTSKHNFCRYYFSHSHLMMLRSYAGMPLARALDFSYSFEQNVAEFCGLTAMSSRVRVELEQCIDPDLLKSYNEKVNKMHDSLFGLKQHLSFGPTIDGVKILQLIDSPLRSIKRLWYGNNSEVTNSAKTKMKLLKMEIVAALKSNQAVVILSREMEPFADVIVVGPGRVLLIQCKQRNQAASDYLDDSSTYVKGWAKVRVSEELFKMGVIDFTAKNAKGEKIADKLETNQEMHDLRVEYLKCLKDAANEGDTSKKEAVVVPIFMLELGSSDGSLTADKFLSGTSKQLNVHFEQYMVSRPGTNNANRLAASPFFPVPYTCGAVADNGKYTTVAEAKGRTKTPNVQQLD